MTIRESLRYVSILRLKTLDLLHITAAKAIGANSVATLDKDIAKKADVIENTTGIKIITVQD